MRKVIIQMPGLMILQKIYYLVNMNCHIILSCKVILSIRGSFGRSVVFSFQPLIYILQDWLQLLSINS